MSLKNSQKGFSLIEGLLVIIALTLIGFAGWYVWNTNHKDTPTKTATTESDSESTTPPANDPTKNWTAFTAKDGSFSLRYPTSWVTAPNPELCDASIVMIAPSKAFVGHCASDTTGQVFITSSSGDNRSSYVLKPAFYKDVASQDVTVDGVKGTKSSGTYTYAGEGLGPELGSKQVTYAFYTGGKTYAAQYSQNATYPDVLSDFDLIVNNTLKFN